MSVFASRRGRRRSRVALALAGSAFLSISTPSIPTASAQAEPASPTPLVASINARLAQLHLGVRSTELPTEKAKRVRAAIKRGDYAAAEEVTRQVLADSKLENWRFYPFEDFIAAVPDVIDPAFKTRLDEWVSSKPDDAVPRLMRARYFYDAGWFARGDRYAKSTLPAHMASFLADLRMAQEDADHAIRLDDRNPYSHYLKVIVLRGRGMSREMRTAFEGAIAKFPAYYRIYDVFLSTLQPKWSGSIPVMHAFVAQYAGRAPADSPLKLLYVSLYRYLLGAASSTCRSKFDTDDKLANCVRSVMRDAAPAELEQQMRDALQLYDRLDKYQFGLAIGDILNDALATSGAEAFSASLLQLVADNMHSETKLEADNPGHNNYVIDLAVASSWFHKDFLDNALKKSQDALHDIHATNFPNAEDKYLAQASVYQLIARIYYAMRQLENEIVYENAAAMTGHLTGYGFLTCFAYHKLQDYGAALRACSKAIDDRPSSMPSRYWRGITYRDLGQIDDALGDLTIVADSEDDIRTPAVIAISMIYFKLKDIRKALSVLNAYPYIYDPKLSVKSDVAVNYNNRCFAYMELGALKQALDDCNASLKYGSLPEAVRKQQEIMRRLKADEIPL